MQYHAAGSNGRKTEKKSILFKNIQKYSEKFITFSNVLRSSFILWGQNNDIYVSKKVEKIYGIQPRYDSMWSYSLSVMDFSDIIF